MKNRSYLTYKIFLPILFIGQLAFAQNQLTGKITASKSNKELPGVSVFIPDLQLGTNSNDKGEYMLNNLPRSIVQIEYSAIGFKTIVKTVNLSGTTKNDVTMETSVTEVEEVLVTSNNSKLPDNTPFSANSISQEEIRKYNAPSLMANLSYQPGIDRISIGNGIGKPVIRGLSFNQIMLYSQGTRIENQQWDDHHDLGISDVGIENVEIVRGPAALIYGADALGGALIFKDGKPAAIATTIADANLGFNANTLGFNGDAGFKSTNKNGCFGGIRFGGTSQTSYIQGEKEGDIKPQGEEEDFAPNSKFMNASVKANAGIIKKWGVSKLSYSFMNAQTGIIEDESADTSSLPKKDDQRDREMEAPYQDVTSYVVSLENTIFLKKGKLNLNLAYQINDRKEYEPKPDKQKELAIGLDLNVTTYDLKYTSNPEKETGITIGMQGTFLQNKNKGTESLVPNADERDIAGYGLFRYDHKKFNILGGIRFDARKIEAESYENNNGIEEDSFIVRHYQNNILSIDTIDKPEIDMDKDFSPLSFSLGASYHANENFIIKLNGATGFTAPNYAQLGTFGKHEGTFRFERGLKTLDMEQNIEGDLGFIWENEFLTLNLGGYINKVKNYIYIINSGDTMVKITPDGTNILPIYDYKQNDATLSGLETSFDIHPESMKWIDINASYAIVKGELDKGGNLPYIPASKLVGEIKLTKEKIGMFNNGYLSFIVSNYSKQKNVAEYELSTDGYTLLDIHIGSLFKIGKQKASFDLFCTNLLNTGYFNQLSLVKYIGVRDMGRNIGATLHIPLYFKN